MFRSRRSSCCGAIAAGVAGIATWTMIAVHAQSPGPAVERFDVSSVKPNRLSEGARGAGFQPGGRFRARNMTVRGIIAMEPGTS